MILLDANVILRYLLQDDDDMSSQAVSILKQNHVFIPDHIMAEVVYVLIKVYHESHERTADILRAILGLRSVHVRNKASLLYALG